MLISDKEFYDLASSEEDNYFYLHAGRTSRSVSVASVSSNSSNPPQELPLPSNSASTSPIPPANPGAMPKRTNNLIMAMFDPTAKVDRQAPPLPDTAGIEYVRAASWASGSCANILADEKGRQLFRCFLFQALAEENLTFLEELDKLKKMKSSDEKKTYAKEVIEKYSPYVNLSSGAMKKLRDAAESDVIDPEDFAPAMKEIRRLLENDQFPRFRRSDVYLDFLEQLLPRSYAEKWTTSFEALLGNHVGRHHFRLFLRGIHAEENLRFWEAVVEFRATKNKSPAMSNLAKVILNTYLAEGASNEVFLPFGVRQVIERRIEDKDVDISIFDEAIKHVEQVLRNDPYVRFLQSPQYMGLIAKLKK
ncbi:unnamed protein product [Auanema sp. JU1783]|nr:unnamed protein product [Auanema sp. JU1783]